MESRPHRIRCANDCLDRIRFDQAHAEHLAEEHTTETGHACTVLPLLRRIPVQVGQPTSAEGVDPPFGADASTEMVED